MDIKQRGKLQLKKLCRCILFLLSYQKELFQFECKGETTITILSLISGSQTLGILFTVFQVNASTKVTDVLGGVRGSSTAVASQDGN